MKGKVVLFAVAVLAGGSAALGRTREREYLPAQLDLRPKALPFGWWKVTSATSDDDRTHLGLRWRISPSEVVLVGVNGKVLDRIPSQIERRDAAHWTLKAASGDAKIEAASPKQLTVQMNDTTVSFSALPRSSWAALEWAVYDVESTADACGRARDCCVLASARIREIRGGQSPSCSEPMETWLECRHESDAMLMLATGAPESVRHVCLPPKHPHATAYGCSSIERDSHCDRFRPGYFDGLSKESGTPPADVVGQLCREAKGQLVKGGCPADAQLGICSTADAGEVGYYAGGAKPYTRETAVKACAAAGGTWTNSESR